jgi:hypothetical protein
MLCPIQFQSFPVLLDSPNSIFETKIEKLLWWSISLFQAIPNRKLVRQIFAYVDCSVGFIQIHFNSPNYSPGYSRLNENIPF